MTFNQPPGPASSGQPRPTVVIITTGGTIASRLDPATDTVVPAVSGADLVTAVPGLAEHAQVEVQPFMNVLGPAMSIADLFSLAQRCNQALERLEVAGVVVTAGTGIIEEGSYLCDLMNTTTKPIVWTGAQYSADMWDTDGPRNLLDAVRLAAHPDAASLGAVVCFNQSINAARDVLKHNTTNVETFTSLDLGILGYVNEDRVVIVRRPAQRRSYAVDHLEENVDLIKLAAGSDDRFLRTSIAAGAKGIVIEGLPGVGIVTPGSLPGVVAAREAGIAVVLASRSLTGRTLSKYGGEIGARDLVKLGVLLAGNLAAPKARLLLMVLLGLSDDAVVLRERFEDASP